MCHHHRIVSVVISDREFVKCVIDSNDRLMVSTVFPTESSRRSVALRPPSECGVLHRESRLYDHRDDLPRPSIQQWQGRAVESQHAGPLPVGGWRSPHRREALLEPFGCVAFSVTSDPETGDYDDQPTVFFRAGQLPSEFDAMP